MQRKMSNEPKLKISATGVSAACSILNTQIKTATATTTVPITTTAETQPSTSRKTPVQQQQQTQSSNFTTTPHKATVPNKVAPFTAPTSVTSVLSLAACKNAFQITHFSPMSDEIVTLEENDDPSSTNILSSDDVVVLNLDSTISAIAGVDNATNTTPTLVTANFTPKVASTEISSNVNNNIVNATNIVNSAEKSKKVESWEECRLKDWDDSRLKNLLEEAYSYKNPRDKENKSETFLQLLQSAENEKDDHSFSFSAITSRYARNTSTSTTSSNHKHGGSLQDLANAVRNESLLDSDYNFGAGSQRNRRHNHNSRKKYSSVSSRQREGGSLPSNVNVTFSGGGSNFLSTFHHHTNDSLIFAQEIKDCNETIISTNTNGNACTSNTVNAKQPRRTKANERSAPVTVGGVNDDKDSSVGINASEISGSTLIKAAAIGVAPTSCGKTSGAGDGDCVIEMGETFIDIQQQQQILQSKSNDANTQSLPFYDRLDNIDMRIPRANIMNTVASRTEFAPTGSQCYVDEPIRITLDRTGGISSISGIGGVGSGGSGTCGQGKTSSITDSKYLPLDENYKSCKSVLGEKSDLTKTQSPMFSTTKTIARQFDENGNSLNEIYSQSGATTALNAVAGGITSSLVGGKSQIGKGKGKQKPQERNATTVDVKSVAGYRGNDPVEVLVKYIESTEDKQNDKSINNNRINENNNKKKERKRDKEKQHKMKKSNSLEELYSCAKIEVDELKSLAATTESSVMMRSKSGKHKNNSASTADINKNYDGSKELSMSKTGTASLVEGTSVGIATVSTSSNHKSERRSWGTEELHYLGVASNSCVNDDKITIKEKRNTRNKEKDLEKNKELAAHKEKHMINTDTAGAIITTSNASTMYKMEKGEKRKKSEANLNINIICGDDLLATDPLLPEASAEFHVVTKKKKVKKQRMSMDEGNGNSGTFLRANNLMSNVGQRSNIISTPLQQRYNKSYNSHATNHDCLSSYNSNHSPNYMKHSVGHVVSDSNKSRRKSTSSMPSSEKSDTSDLDSVHSLPIESMNSTKNKQCRHKNNKKDDSSSAIETTATSISTTVAIKLTNSAPAPISYADIARTSKELQHHSTSGTLNNNIASDEKSSITVDIFNNNVPNIYILSPENVAEQGVMTIATSVKQKTKKPLIKLDFPELIAPTTQSTALVVSNEFAKPVIAKQISYSQSLVAAPEATASVPLYNNENNMYVLTASIGDIDIKEKNEKRIIPTIEMGKNDGSASNCGKHLPALQQQIQKKSMDLDNYSYNNCNMDQQYPALEKTFKKHLQPAYVTNSTPASVVIVGKQQLHQHNHQQQQYNINTNNNKSANEDYAGVSFTSTTQLANVATMTTSLYANAVTNSSCTVRKSKEKAMHNNVILSNELDASISTVSSLPNANNSTCRKGRKDKHQISDASIVMPKTTTATQTHTTHVISNKSRPHQHTVEETTSCGSAINFETNNRSSTYNMNNNNNNNSCTRINKNNCINNKYGSGTIALETLTATTTNRPAVIILNDDRNMDGGTSSNEFTFGDFNEEELKFLDDEGIMITNEDDGDYKYHEKVLDQMYADMEDGDDSIVDKAYVKGKSNRLSSSTKTPRAKTSAQTISADPMSVPSSQRYRSDCGTQFNMMSNLENASIPDLGDVCTLNNSSQQVDETMFTSGNESSASPNFSLVMSNRTYDAGIYSGTKGKVHSNYTINMSVKKKASPKKDRSANSSSNPNTSGQPEEKQQLYCNSLTQTDIVGSTCSAPPLQLETCNDIETAIIAAAKAAAEQQHHHQQQQRQQQHQHSHHRFHQQSQQVQQHEPNSNSSSASSSFSSSSLSIETKYSYNHLPQQHHQNHQQQQQQQQHPQQQQHHQQQQQQQQLHSQYHQHQHYQQQQQYQQQHNHYQHHPSNSHNYYNYQYQYYHQQLATDDDEYSNSSSQREDATGVPVMVATSVNSDLCKELELRYIPPPDGNTMQYNEVIVNFIESAWEEISNSKVVKFYDEQ